MRYCRCVFDKKGKKRGVCLKCIHDELMKDDEFREEWYKPNDLGQTLTFLRENAGITQKQLAEMVGTKQSSIARFENSMSMPSLSWVYKLYRALGFRLHIEPIEIKDNQQTNTER